MSFIFLPRLFGLIVTVTLWVGSTLALAEPIAVIVNHKNPITSLKETNISAMYRGEELHWAHGGRIKLVNREISSSIREQFYQEVLNARSDQLFFRPGTPVAVQSLIQRSDEAVVRFVSAIAGAIGYVNLSSVNDSVHVVIILQERTD